MSGLISWRGMPVAFSTSITRSAGTRFRDQRVGSDLLILNAFAKSLRRIPLSRKRSARVAVIILR